MRIKSFWIHSKYECVESVLCCKHVAIESVGQCTCKAFRNIQRTYISSYSDFQKMKIINISDLSSIQSLPSNEKRNFFPHFANVRIWGLSACILTQTSGLQNLKIKKYLLKLLLILLLVSFNNKRHLHLDLILYTIIDKMPKNKTSKIKVPPLN